MINNGKTLNRVWGALVSDFEVLMGRFMDQPSWTFLHFAQIARDMQISLIMNMTVGRGKLKVEHYDVISSLIIQTAKSFWLRARDVEFDDVKLCRKRRLGGFYLTYMFYFKQPYKGRTKIKLGPQDMSFCEQFIEDVKLLQNAEEIMFQLTVLKVNGAYSYHLHEDEFGIESWQRSVLTNQKSAKVAKCFDLRDVQDWLAYGTQHSKVDRALMLYNFMKNKFADQMYKCCLRDHVKLLIENHSYSSMFLKTECLEKFREAVVKIGEVANEPVLTMEQLTATDYIDRRILAETRKRIKRQRKKIMSEPGKAANPYVREGGIYGRKKEVDTDKASTERRERGMCSGNLWTYINRRTFDKPLGHLLSSVDVDKKAADPTVSADEPKASTSGSKKNVDALNLSDMIEVDDPSYPYSLGSPTGRPETDDDSN